MKSSQSHLDTLGLCVFLALANLDTPANTILVLDDVLASVDEPHVDRLIAMLYNEAQKFRHCMITTHYGPWRHTLRWGWLKNNQCQFVELSRWSNTQGISVILGECRRDPPPAPAEAARLSRSRIDESCAPSHDTPMCLRMIHRHGIMYSSSKEDTARMNRTHAIELLVQSKPILMQRYGVVRLALFGSTVRDTARSDSDLDILVAFDGPATSARYFGVQFYLEDLFGCPVDLVTEKALRAELRPFIEKDAVHV